jgi:DnaJ-class molecular chaperone
MDFVRMGEVQPQYAKFLNFYLLGAPELYEIIGLNPKSLSEDIIKRCENGSELFKKIGSILGDPSKRSEYDFLMYFVERYGTGENHEERSRNAKKWKKIDRNIIEKILIISLDHSDASDKYDIRLNNIISANQDWKLYLPPGKKTFFSILGIEKSSLSGDKKEIEKILREKYRYLEKTNEVNLAYSVLKNESQRADYLWLSDNINMFNALEQIYSKEEEEVPLINKKKRKGLKKQGVKKKPPSQVTFDDLARMMEKIFEMEAIGQKKRTMK